MAECSLPKYATVRTWRPASSKVLDIAGRSPQDTSVPCWWQRFQTKGRNAHMAEKGKAAVFLGPGKGYEIREFDVPDPEPDAVVIKISMGGICGSDLHTLRGGRPAFSA